MRGLALLGVVVFHLFGAGRVFGGIDIFLAVSGFLFTGMLLREAAASGGRLDLFRYFGRLARRILVPAAIVFQCQELIKCESRHASRILTQSGSVTDTLGVVSRWAGSHQGRTPACVYCGWFNAGQMIAQPGGVT